MGPLVDRDPELFWEIYAVNRESHRGRRASYQVSTRFAQTPAAGPAPDAALAQLLSKTHSRQVLHGGYGVVGNPHNEQRTTWLGDSLRSLLSYEASCYAWDSDEGVGSYQQAFSETTR